MAVIACIRCDRLEIDISSFALVFGFLRGIPGVTDVYIPHHDAVVLLEVTTSVQHQVIGDWKAANMLLIGQGESLLQRFWQKNTPDLSGVQTHETNKNKLQLYDYMLTGSSKALPW